MKKSLRPNDPEEQSLVFYANALSVLSGPTRTMATVMRVLNLVYYILMFAAMGWIFSQVIDRTPAVNIKSSRLVADGIYPGEQLKVEYDIERLRQCQSDTTWTVYDGANEIRRFGPVTVQAAGKVGPDIYVRAWTIPQNAAPGPARLRVALSWQCPGNYLHAIYPVTTILPDVNFTIVPRPK